MNEDLWFVETPGEQESDAPRNAVLDHCTLPPRPAVAQTVGIIRFSHSTPYPSKAAFRAAEDKHRIRQGGSKDWLRGHKHFAWHVSKSLRLETPADPPPTKGNVTARAYTLTVRLLPPDSSAPGTALSSTAPALSPRSFCPRTTYTCCVARLSSVCCSQCSQGRAFFVRLFC